VSDLAATIAARLADVRGRIAAAAARAGRDAATVRLVAVSKTYSADHVRAAVAAGQQDFGENKVQEGLQKITETADTTIRWHVIGHLQSNKARKAAEAFHWIHAVDSVSLLTKIDEGAAAAGRRPRALVQVDLAGEATKFGASPDEVPGIFAAAAGRRAVDLVGRSRLPPASAWEPDCKPLGEYRAASDRVWEYVAAKIRPDILRSDLIAFARPVPVATLTLFDVIEENLFRRIVISGRLDVEGTNSVASQLAELTQAPKKGVVIDLSALEFLASIGIRAIITAAKAVKERGGKMVLVVDDGSTVRMSLKATGVDQLVPVFHSPTEAERAARA